MKLSDIETGALNAQEWADKGYELPKFDLKAVRAKTHDQPTWIHFGAGNIFRAFPAALLQRVLDAGEYDRGVIVAEGFDYEIIDKAYRPYDNLSLSVLLKSDGSIEKRVVASVTESLKADPQFHEDWERLEEIFKNPSLQMVSFTITEKGYSISPADLERGAEPQLIMGKVTALLYQRYQAGELPITVQSMDNCSHNGDKVKSAVLAYAQAWVKAGLVPHGFLDYLQDEAKVSFPWSMIDKITPRPDAKVQDMLKADGFEDNYTIITEKHTYTAPFVNAEETEYLVIEDKYTNGRPPLEKGGVLYADRETVDKVEKDEGVHLSQPPAHRHVHLWLYAGLHPHLRGDEGRGYLRPSSPRWATRRPCPWWWTPACSSPADFIGAVLTKRLPNPFMPDAPQRIATDTSQKLPIRFGETIKAYSGQGAEHGRPGAHSPWCWPATPATSRVWDDAGKPFEPSPRPPAGGAAGYCGPSGSQGGPPGHELPEGALPPHRRVRRGPVRRRTGRAHRGYGGRAVCRPRRRAQDPA